MNLLMALILGGFLGISSLASAGELSVEIDPSTFAFNGYSAHLRYHLLESWELGIGTYSMTFPNALGGLVISPNPSTTTLKISSAYGFFLDKFLFDKNERVFLGFQLASQNYLLSDSGTPGSTSRYSATLFMPRVGYKYTLKNSGLYFLPWLGVGYIYSGNDNPSVGSQTYKLNSILPFATIHMGYSF